ncbi:response regulator [Bradyrhizobium sp. Tv2a-2]|uniref:response regulator n=1 Tax=Bradyrhizobium sp. Tv2a-2 TaxID=113395 RepID=UPI0003FAD8B9|nr:response regulator [Bradyrhizobium sp. Tv2a-2]
MPEKSLIDLIRRAHELDVVSIVHADQALREELTGVIFSAGYVAEPFDGADAFLRSSCVIRTSCLIADIQLPEMTGRDLYKRLVSAGKRIPTILLADRGRDRLLARALRGCITHYHKDPLNDNELLACVKASLGRQAVRRSQP